MKLQPVKYLPESEPKAQYKTLSGFFREFIRMNTKYAKIIFGPSDYATPEVASKSIYNQLRRYSTYPIKLKIVNSEVYLVRTDMEG